MFPVYRMMLCRGITRGDMRMYNVCVRPMCWFYRTKYLGEEETVSGRVGGKVVMVS